MAALVEKQDNKEGGIVNPAITEEEKDIRYILILSDGDHDFF